MTRLLPAALCTALLCSGAAFADSLPLGYTPAANSNEAGLWMMSEQMEKGFQTSPLLVRDEKLNAYVKSVVCKLVPDRCESIRVYILDIPYFNAAMSPNGAMQVWTGLLARVSNEAELAVILGHEISHYLLRHTLEMWQRVRNTSGFASILTVASGGVGALVGLAALSTLYAYSRDEEREADASGLDLAVAAGYDPAAGVALWNGLLAEERADPAMHDGFYFFKSHPEPDERMSTMQKRADAMNPPSGGWLLGDNALHDAVAPLRGRWLGSIVALGRTDAALVLLRRMTQAEPGDGTLQFYLGEVYRRRNAKGDAEQALAAYRAALATPPAPAETWRGLGLVAMKTGDKKTAFDAFTHYLEAVPQADDRAMIAFYLKKVQE